MSYDKAYFDNRKQELQQENLKNILEVYDDILRVMQKSVAKTQDINKKFQEIVAKEEESKKKDTKEVVPAPAKSEK
jgi:hypothetical protein